MDEAVDRDPDRRRGPARRSRWRDGCGRAVRRRRRRRRLAETPAACAAGPPRSAASSNACARSIPAASASRTSVGGAQPDRAIRGQGERRARAGPARSRAAGVEDEAAVHPRRAPPGRARRTGSRSRPGPAPSSRSATEPCPGRIELGGRLVEDQDARAHRHDARDRDPLLLAAGQGERLAVGEVGDRQPRRASSSIRASISARGMPRFSSPKASSSRTVSFDADSWLAGVAKTMPTRPSSAPAAAPSPCRPRRSRSVPSSLARTTRGMNPAAARASVDLPAPVRPATPTRSPAATETAMPVERRLAPARIADRRGPRSGAAPTRLRSPRVIAEDAGRASTTTTPTARDDDQQRSQRSIGGSATTR